MKPEQHEPTTTVGQNLPYHIVEELRAQMEQGKRDQVVEVIEEIRQEFGIGWAIYCSAFMGRAADNWRVDVCEAMR